MRVELQRTVRTKSDCIEWIFVRGRDRKVLKSIVKGLRHAYDRASEALSVSFVS